ncbi:MULTISPECIES: choice-of-anchor C family protein [Streptomyces]|uniref:Choice-of-anchor C family protein n=1 Tax=Streptomyces sudanensis TaxID=436397 RepID=A0ABY4TGP4_9ACTN|nr:MULTISPECIES: choice-of-anchor C family protein [Streptomyces]MCP9958927.1 choice-of-anchor C family protein [Streptomyces sudanensis]MCP9987996.1 choice-of-anchor C family protein [Streptomyces sudanensis]MCQ0000596.1 choice-of-anchor C family protein [Streptomyces sudanensis]URN16180.1 choice-of-anchor C family protein [Streptomyces sudanensis]
MVVSRSLAAVATAGLLAAGTVMALAAPAAAASRFDDGSFEYPTAPANAFTTVSAGQPIGPWKVTGGAVDLIGTGFWQAAEGGQSVDLNATQAGAVAQTFTTTAGKRYTVTYSLAANPEGGPAVKTGRVLVDGQNFQDFSFDSTGKTRASMGYVTRQVTFVANGPTTTLGFASTVTGAYGPVVDDVRVESCCGCGDGC